MDTTSSPVQQTLAAAVPDEPEAGDDNVTFGRTASRPGLDRSGLRKLAWQFGLYAVVGGIAFLADFGVLFLLASRAGFHYLVAAAAGFLVGVTINYVLSVRWVFDRRRLQSPIAEFQVFALIGLIGLGLNEIFMWVLTDGLNAHYLISKMCAAALLLVWNFSARRYALFS